jgi:hypothetical protein
MKHRYIEMSGQGHRFDVMTPDNRRICIAHSKIDAVLIVKALNAETRKREELDYAEGSAKNHGVEV